MYELNLQHKFSAAHFLENYNGECANMHGHTWKIDIKIKTNTLHNDMVIDFKIIKKAIDDRFDHTIINKMVKYNPTAENIAKNIYEMVRKLYYDIAPKGEDREEAKIEIEVWESDDASIKYSEKNYE